MVIQNCTHCLAIDKSNVKAAFRRGQAYELLKEMDKACGDYKMAAEMAPGDLAIQKKLIFVEDLKRQDEISKKMMATNLQKMFK